MHQSRLTTGQAVLAGGLCAGILTLWALPGCRSTDERPLQSRMRDSYTAITELYRFAAVPSAFENPKNERRIQTLLERLTKNFHSVEAITPIQEFEPGFRIALQINQATLNDAHKRFSEGEKEYAGWRLRGLLNSCVACHTRYRISADFTGDVPTIDSSNSRDRLAVSEFLVATRQFEKAEQELLAQATTAVRNNHDASQPLKLWLLVQTRVRGTPEDARVKIQELLAVAQRQETREMLLNWVADIELLRKRSFESNGIAEAQWLLEPARLSVAVQENDRHLVRSLRATSILHPLLLTRSLTAEQRAQATYLLALAYEHIDIRSLDTFRTEYLEQCVREFPMTPQAKQCYAIYEEEIEFEASGSSGLQLPQEEVMKLRELRNLAFGAEASVLHDTSPTDLVADQ